MTRISEELKIALVNLRCNNIKNTFHTLVSTGGESVDLKNLKD